MNTPSLHAAVFQAVNASVLNQRICPNVSAPGDFLSINASFIGTTEISPSGEIMLECSFEKKPFTKTITFASIPGMKKSSGLIFPLAVCRFKSKILLKRPGDRCVFIFFGLIFRQSQFSESFQAPPFLTQAKDPSDVNLFSINCNNFSRLHFSHSHLRSCSYNFLSHG